MAYRRIVITTTKTDELKKELDRLFSVTKNDFPELKHKIIQGIKPNTTIIDLMGEGADSFANKVKDSGAKIGATDVKIKKEKKLSPMKEDKKANLKEYIKKQIREQLDKGMSKDALNRDTEESDKEYYSPEARKARLEKRKSKEELKNNIRNAKK